MWNKDSLRLVPAFFKDAKKLRSHFVDQFKDPFQTQASRFVWDYWNVPHTFRAIRTPAYEYFPQSIYKQFHEHLVLWGRENLGCHDVSPPWMSYYVDGCYQNTHVDAPHGPWAFVYSLTPWETRKFKGGETFLLSRGKQKLIAPRFNQLTVFDPSVKHGVKTVLGIENPLEARLVIHGWFVNPRPFIQGKISTGELEAKISGIGEWLEQERMIAKGWTVIRFQVNASGRVNQLKTLWSRVESKNSRFRALLEQQVSTWSFSRKSGSSLVTLPMAFE